MITQDLKDKFIEIQEVIVRDDIYWHCQDKRMTNMLAIVKYTYKKKDKQINNANPLYSVWEKAIYKGRNCHYIKIGTEKVYLNPYEIFEESVKHIKTQIKMFENYENISFKVGSRDARDFRSYLEFKGYEDDGSKIDYLSWFSGSFMDTLGNVTYSKSRKI